MGALGLPWIITASSVGTLIEWYDFYLYGVLALFFSRHFFSPEPALDAWADSRTGTRKTMIVALARKLLIALWRFVTTGETLQGVILRPAG